MISYYFGGKKELYEKVVYNIVNKILFYMKIKTGFKEFPQDIDKYTKQEKMELLFKIFDLMIDYFYSEKFSDSSIMIIFREQITSGVPINTEGYNLFKRLIASILGKNENDKEVIFKTITIIGQVHAPRMFKQFSLNMMGQSGYSKEDIQMLKLIIIAQVKAILTISEVDFDKN